MKITKPSALGALVLVCLLGGGTAGAHADEADKDTFEEVVVRAHPLSAKGLAQPISVISAEKLQRVVASSIGETLTGLPGVHSSSFGQAVGRPVIRGLGGPRVKTMEDRIDSLDVSVTSPDHLTTIEPFAADSIEVLKGPSTLLYGTGAIGGVVNVHTGRIPQRVPESPLINIDARGADNAGRRSSAIRFDAGAGDFAVHLDAFYRKADEYDIPGFAESGALRLLEEEVGDEGDEEEAEAYGKLPSSQMRANGGAIGFSRVGKRGFIGLAVSAYEADYGLPGGHSHGHHEEEEHSPEADEEHAEEGNPTLDLEQIKVDFESGINAPFKGIDTLNVRVGVNDYEHTEVEGNGEVGTRFTTEAVEGRLEFVHKEVFGIRGIFGLQISQRDFAASGEEAFVLPVDTNNVGIFYLGERSLGPYNVEAGIRLERVKHNPTAARSRRFDLEAVSLGLIRPIGDHWTITAQVDHSSRAPVAEELYSDGPHLVTGSYEIGDPTLDKEVATNVAATVQYENDVFRFAVSAYRTDFQDFIFESPTGAELDELPVLLWQQEDAVFDGFEADLDWQAVSWSEGSLTLNAGVDAVNARFSGSIDGDLPRLPPRRWRLGAMLDWHNFTAELAYTKVENQNDVAVGELPTKGFDNLKAYLGYRTQLDDATVEFFVRGDNLTDDEQRYHTSFIKDLAPQPGRTIEVGVTIKIRA